MSTAVVPVSSATTVVSTSAVKSSPSILSVPITALSKLNLTPNKGAGGTSAQGNTTPLGTPGRWQHPRMNEVIRRRNATNFDSSNMKAAVYNTGFIIISLFIPMILKQIVPTQWLQTTQPYLTYTLLLIRLIFAVNVGFALSPLFRKPDSCEDVPLTPSQRQLLGLPPMSRPATPLEKEQYVTPPRFSRSATPHSSTSSLFAEASNSPLNGRGSTPLDRSPRWAAHSGSTPGSTQNRTEGGSYSPLTPGLRTGGERRRLSYTSNRSSPLSISEFDAAGSISTPSKGNKATVGLNNKWLYEKGRGSPRSSLMKSSPYS